MLNDSLISKTNSSDNSPHWEWTPCHFDLKRESKKKIEYLNIGSQASFFLENQEIDILMNIKMDKDLHFSENLSCWVWHKSWNLPFFKVSIDFIDPDTLEHYEIPKNLYVEMLAVKPSLENLRSFHLIDVGLTGNNKMKLNDIDCLFSSLKFNTTSYNHKEAKFHLTVSLIQKDPETPPIYLKTFISPPIFVDSRKSARNSNDLKLKHLNAFIEVFPIESLRRNYMKKYKKHNNINDCVIENNLRGLYDYLTAPNIRDKVKNPLFLSVKFNECVKILYDETQISHKDNMEQIIYEYFKSIQNFFNKGSSKKTKLFLMILCFKEFAVDHFYLKKILDVYDVFKGSPLEISSELEQIQSNYHPLTFSSFGDFEIIYKKAQDLCQKSPSILSDSDENESFDDTDILAMEKPKKKLKIEDSILEDFGLEQKSFEKETTNTFEFAIRTEIQIYPKKANEAKFDYLQFFELKERKKSVEHEIKEEEKKPEKMKEKEEIPLKKEEEEEKKEIIKIEIKNEVENEIKSPFSFKQNVNMPDQSKHYPYQHVSFMNNQNNNTSFQQLNNYNIINNYNNGFLTHQQQIFPQQQNFNYMSNLSTIPFNQQNIFYQQQNNLNINRQGNHVFFLNLKKQ